MAGNESVRPFVLLQAQVIQSETLHFWTTVLTNCEMALF